MRLPLTIDLMTRDGSVEKDQKLVNSHSSDDGVNKRPGVTDLGLVEAGVAQLLACWNGLLSVIGDSLAKLVITAVPAQSGIVGTIYPSLGSPSTYPTSVLFVGDNTCYMSAYDELNEVSFLAKVVIGGDNSLTITSPSSNWATFMNITSLRASATSLVITSNNLYGLGDFEGELFSTSLTEPLVPITRSTSASFNANGVIYKNSTFVSLWEGFNSSRVRYSTNDGVTWTSRSIATTNYVTVCWDGALWWFIGEHDTNGLTFHTSADLTTFNTVTVTGLPLTLPNLPRFFDYSTKWGKYIVYITDGTTAGGYTSTDGLSWTLDTTLSTASSLTLGQDGEVYILASDGVIKQWTPTGLVPLYDVASLWSAPPYKGGLFVNGKSLANDPTFVIIPDYVFGQDISRFFVCSSSTQLPARDEVNSTPVADLSPSVLNAALIAQSTGAAQSQQQMFIKAPEQAWIYTP